MLDAPFTAILAGIIIFTTLAIIMGDSVPALGDQKIFYIEVAFAGVLALLVFSYSRKSDRATKENLNEVRSMLKRNEQAKQIQRARATKTLHSTVRTILDACNIAIEMSGRSNETLDSEWRQVKADLAALHEKIRASTDKLGRDLEQADYLDDRAYDGIAAAVGQLEETICANDEERTVDTAQYRAMTSALGPLLDRLDWRFGPDAGSPPAAPGPEDPANMSDRLEIRLDRTVYYPNATIRATVSADEPFPSRKVTVEILDESLAVLAKKTKKTPKAGRAGAGTLAVEMRPKDLIAGNQYIARATCGGLVSEKVFAVDQARPVVLTDKSVYMMGGDMIITVIDPAANRDSAAAEHVGNTKKSKLVIKSPHGTIDGYRLKETGDSTGIFQGLVRFTGVRDDGSVRGTILDDGVYVDKTQGTGIDDGVIACAPNSLVQIKYANEFGTGEATVFTTGFVLAIDLDRDEYPCTGSVRIQVIAPDFSPGGDGPPATIGDDRRDFWVTISTSEGSLDGYRLEEVDSDSGVFAGTVSLTGLAGMRGRKRAAGGAEHGATRGSGPHDGMLACGPSDAVRVSVKSAFAKEVHKTAKIGWHVGDIQMSKATYLPGEEVAVRVKDSDMSVSHDRPDEFVVRAWSDSDHEGVPVTVRETGSDSGVFEGRFRTGDDRSRPEQSFLAAADGDAVYAEYVDGTLPGPYGYNDSVDITSSALVTTKKSIPAPPERLVVDDVLVWNEKTGGDALVAGDKVQVLARVRNPGREISFTALLQVAGLDGAMAEVLYHRLSARAGGYATHTFSWIPPKPGIYGVHLALWKSIDDPVAYSPSVFKPVEVLGPQAAGAGRGGDRGVAGPSSGAHDDGGPGPPAHEGERRGAGHARRASERRRRGR